MCQQVIIDDRAVVLDQGEFRRFVPPADWVKRPGYEASTYRAGDCLCPIDVAATLTKQGYAVEQDAADAMLYVARKA